MSIFDKPPRYRAFLLRYWEERGQGARRGVVWRFSLEDAHTGQRQGFASLEEMVAFLRSQLKGKTPPSLADEPKYLFKK
ncbi:MAG: hypothetical protein ISS49_05505 [Anaerolineae bacterium]|nr:hypothetical protein [Anaerolineae bacterium]